MANFLVLMAQGRSGSTALLRMLNAVPGVRIAGENEKALDHLRQFVACFANATKHHHSEFYRLAWMLPCPIDVLKRKAGSFLLDIYNPNSQYRLAGFKEIRYGRDYQQLCDDISFLTEVLPGLKIVFNTRATEDAVKSDFWRDDPQLSSRILDMVYGNFLRYHGEHRGTTYWMPYEEIRDGSAVLQGMFDFLGVEFTSAARTELARRLR